MSRNLREEFHALDAQLREHPGNRELRKRRDHCSAAIKSPALVPDYLDSYPAPRGTTGAAKRAADADYSSKRRPEPERIPSDEDFVRAWVTSSSIQEAAEKLDLADRAGWVSSKAGAMKRHGVHLPDLKRRRSDVMDIDALNRIIEEARRG